MSGQCLYLGMYCFRCQEYRSKKRQRIGQRLKEDIELNMKDACSGMELEKSLDQLLGNMRDRVTLGSKTKGSRYNAMGKLIMRLYLKQKL